MRDFLSFIFSDFFFFLILVFIVLPAIVIGEIVSYFKASAEEQRSKRTRLLIYGTPAAVFIAGMILLNFPTDLFDDEDEIPIFWDSLQYSVILLGLFGWYAWKKFANKWSVAKVLAISAVVFPFFGWPAEIHLNSWLARAPKENHEVRVMSKFTMGSVQNPFVLVRRSWREPEKDVRLFVTRQFYEQVDPRRSKMVIVTRPGAFGFDVMEGYYLAGSE